MPTYEYRCNSCSRECEIVQSIKDEPVTYCTVCGQNELVRQISNNTTFILKGGMWGNSGYSSAVREQLKTLPRDDTDE